MKGTWAAPAIAHVNADKWMPICKKHDLQNHNVFLQLGIQLSMHG